MNFGGNNKRSIKERITEFMYGRNGIDDLYHFLFWIIIIKITYKKVNKMDIKNLLSKMTLKQKLAQILLYTGSYKRR